mgnify:CR=1 FL=1
MPRGRIYDSITDTIGDTPCVRVRRLAPEHVRLYVKLELFNYQNQLLGTAATRDIGAFVQTMEGATGDATRTVDEITEVEVTRQG